MLKWIKGRWKSFGYAAKGIVSVVKAGPNMNIMLVAVVVVVSAGVYFNITKYEWALVTFAMALVIIAEAFNTAIEKLTDLVQPNHDPRAGYIKDLAAGGVLLATLAAAIIGGLVFGSYLFP